MDLFYSSISLVKKLIFSETLHDQPFFSIPQKGTVNKTLNGWSQDLSLGVCFVGTQKLLWRGVIFSCVRMSTHRPAGKNGSYLVSCFAKSFYIAVRSNFC